MQTQTQIQTEKYSPKVEEAVKEVDVSTVDSYLKAKATLASQMRELEPLTKVVEAYEKEFREIAEQYLSEEQVIFKGSVRSVQLGAKPTKVINIDRAALRKALGKQTFDELWTIGVTAIRQYLTPPQQKDILTEERSGTRTIKTIDNE